MMKHRLLLILSASLVACVSGQYGHYRPYPMSMAPGGFSPYHPARINHETLPISQAEFAQLVAESMATSNGPHHHHPPNTDADYEGADHYRSYHNGGGRGHHGGGESAHNTQYHHQSSPHASHYDHKDSSSHEPQEHSHHEPQEQYEPQEHGSGNGYQPDENEHEYPRQAVYENEHKGRGSGGGDMTEEEENNNYGGRPGSSESYDGYDEGMGDHDGNQQIDDNEQEQYMAASSPVVHKYRYVVDSHQ